MVLKPKARASIWRLNLKQPSLVVMDHFGRMANLDSSKTSATALALTLVESG